MSNKEKKESTAGCCDAANQNVECGCEGAAENAGLNETEEKKCSEKSDCCGKNKHASHGKSVKAAAKAYEQAKQQPEEIQQELADALNEVKDEMATEGKQPSSEPDYKLIAHKTAAEFDNYRKRVAREKEIWKREALGDFLKEFLPAFDDLNRAILEGEKGHSYEVIHDGAKLVRDNLWKTIMRAGVSEIEAADKEFDPRYHEAMTMIPMPDKKPNTVIEVFQAGYMIGDFVLRPAKVVVAAEV